jgi:SAM-dependent methyltransferase
MDLGGGPGDLATQLALSGADVTLVDVSEGFLQVAAQLATQRAVAIRTVNESLNRLIHHDDIYDIVTIAQAIHWLDPVTLMTYLNRALSDAGQVFVVQSRFDVAESHPFADLFGKQSRLGAPQGSDFITEISGLARHLSALSDVLGRASAAQAPLGVKSIQTFRQRRPIDLGFARAFISEGHLKAAGIASQTFWLEMEARNRDLDAGATMAALQWAIIQFERGASAPSSDINSEEAHIGFQRGDGLAINKFAPTE